jgi:phosphoenolpyruvate synthase/pyruvate phosphate dikinase
MDPNDIESIRREAKKYLVKQIEEFEANLKPVTPEMLAAAASARNKAKKKPDKIAQKNIRKIQSLKGKKILEGIAASPGIAVGVVRNVHERDLLIMAQIKHGEVMVSSRTVPEDSLFMEKASAFITDSGGKTSSTAIVAMSMGKPAVTATIESTIILKDGQRVVVDGTEGVVYSCKEKATPSSRQ